MSSRHDPANSLLHIIENAERAARHIAGTDRDAFERNEWARDAVERRVERVCEAVHRLGERAEQLMPGQPWSDIRGMGNRPRHVARTEKIVAGAISQRTERHADGFYYCHAFGSNVGPVMFSSLDEVAEYLRSNPRSGVRMVESLAARVH